MTTGIVGEVNLSREYLATRIDQREHLRCSLPTRRPRIVQLSAYGHAKTLRSTSDSTRQIQVVFDGDIRNRSELRSSLSTKGQADEWNDAELLLHLYKKHGELLTQYLEGGFAFAIADADRLLLGRDCFGIKPLHYAHVPDANLFVFATDAKSILQNPRIGSRLDLQAFTDSVALGHPVGDSTFFDRIKVVEPSHVLSVSFEAMLPVKKQPLSPWSIERDESLTARDAQKAVQKKLEDAIVSYADNGTTVGITLSGGVDSTILAVLAREQGVSIRTFTVADEEQHPDVFIASKVAETLGVPHHPLIITFQEYLTAIPRCIEATEALSNGYAFPFGILCRKIASEVDLCFDGEGADEVFGGYQDYVTWRERIGFIRQRLQLLERLHLEPSPSAMSIVERLFSVMTSRRLLETVFALNRSDRLARFALDPIHRYSNAAGLRMVLPFVDDQTVQLASRLPMSMLVNTDLGFDKYVLRRLLLDRSEPVLNDVVMRKKIGLPGAAWRSLKRFDGLCRRLLPHDYLEQHDLGTCFGSKRSLFLFELFLETFITHRGDSQQIGSVMELLRARASA